MTASRRLLIAFMVALASIISGCSCSSDRQRARDAAELGISHAAQLCDTTLTGHELTRRLLAVRAHEWELRKSGNDAAADAYINAFREKLQADNDSLASRIF